MRLRLQIKLAPRSRPNVVEKTCRRSQRRCAWRCYSTVEVPETSLSWREYQKGGHLRFRTWRRRADHA